MGTHRLISLFAFGFILSFATSELYASCNGGILRAVFGSQQNHCEPRCASNTSACISICPSVPACVETNTRSSCQSLQSTSVHVPHVLTPSGCVSSCPQLLVQPSVSCVPAHVVPSINCEVITLPNSVVVPNTSCCESCDNAVSPAASVEAAPLQAEVKSRLENDPPPPVSDPSPSDELRKLTPEASKSSPTPDSATPTSASSAVPTSQTAEAPSEPAKTDIDRQTDKKATQSENSVQLAKEDLNAAKLAAEAEAKKLEAERLVAEAKAQEIEKQQLEKAALEKAALEKAALEKAALEKAALEKAELEKAALEKAELEKAALEKERLEKERLEKERLAKQQQLEQERLAQEQSQREQAEKDRLEKQRIEAERLEAERLAQEKAAQPSQPKAAAVDASLPATNSSAANTTPKTATKPQVPASSDLMLSVKSIQIADKKPDGEQWDSGTDADIRLVVTAAGVTIRPPDGKDKNAIELDRGVARVKVGYIIQIDASDVDLMFNDPVGATKHTVTEEDFAKKSIELSFGSVKSLVLELSQ